MSGRADRWSGVEAGRAVAALAIVWLHAAGVGPATGRYGVAGRFAVPCFAGLAVFFAARAAFAPNRGAGAFVRDRFVRIYLPFLFWTAAYLALRFAKAAVAGPSGKLFVGPQLLVVGSAHHLWFLPFALVVTVAARLLAHPLARMPWLAASASLVGGLALCGTDFGISFDVDDPDPANQSLYGAMLAMDALPAALWGLALGLVVRNHRPPANALAAAGFVLAAAACIAILASTEEDTYRRALANAAGILFLLAGMATPPSRWVDRLGTLGRYSFGVYILHVAFLQAAEMALRKPRAGLALPDTAFMAAAAWLGSLATAWALLRFRATAWLVR